MICGCSSDLLTYCWDVSLVNSIMNQGKDFNAEEMFQLFSFRTIKVTIGKIDRTLTIYHGNFEHHHETQSSTNPGKVYIFRR